MTTHCARWIRHDLPGVVATFFGGDVSAMDQVRSLFIQFRGGMPMELSRQYKQLSPASDGIWELKTGDVRIFGWFVQQDCFVAADAAGKAWIMDDSRVRYGNLMRSCVAQRDALDLDLPKFISSGDARDVITN